MKKLAVFLCLIGGACAQQVQETGPGFGGEVVVKVTLDGKTIKDIAVVSHNESSYVGGKAFPILKEEILAQQSPVVDNISGASFTSFAYKMAVAKALKKADFGDYKITFDTPNTNTLVKGTDITTDVLIIGGGGAGLTAAITAKEQGSSVILIEKMGLLGGNTLYSVGGLNAAGTKHQKAQDIADTPEAFYQDTMKGGRNLNDPELVKIFTSEGSNIIEWLEERNIELSKLSISGGSSARRTHQPQGGYAVGPYLVEGLIANATTLAIDIRVNTKANDLIITGNQIRGVVVSDKTQTYTINAKSVIIATGGFGANLELVASYNPKLKGFRSSNQKGATGDIFPIVRKKGIQLKDMNQIQIHPTGEANRSLLITETVRGTGALMVNSEGKRFVDELQTRDLVSAAILKQSGQKAYLIYDEQVRTSLGAIKSYESLKLVQSGKTIEELAQKLKIDPTTLATTVTEFNDIISSQKDPLGRSQFGKTISEPSFYAIAVVPVVHHTMGGIAINTNSQVLLNNNNPIKGLYAAGEVTGGIHGANRLGGNAVADITIFGRRSGLQASEFAKNNP